MFVTFLYRWGRLALCSCSHMDSSCSLGPHTTLAGGKRNLMHALIPSCSTGALDRRARLSRRWPRCSTRRPLHTWNGRLATKQTTAHANAGPNSVHIKSPPMASRHHHTRIASTMAGQMCTRRRPWQAARQNPAATACGGSARTHRLRLAHCQTRPHRLLCPRGLRSCLAHLQDLAHRRPVQARHPRHRHLPLIPLLLIITHGHRHNLQSHRRHHGRPLRQARARHRRRRHHPSHPRLRSNRVRTRHHHRRSRSFCTGVEAVSTTRRSSPPTSTIGMPSGPRFSRKMAA